MPPSPGNSPAPSTRWRSRRRRRGKRTAENLLPRPERQGNETLKRGARPLRLFLLDLGLARHRHDPQRGDAVTLAAQDAETEAVEGETLAPLRDRARLVNHEAGDGGRLFIGQMPVHRAVEIAD